MTYLGVSRGSYVWGSWLPSPCNQIRIWTPYPNIMDSPMNTVQIDVQCPILTPFRVKSGHNYSVREICPHRTVTWLLIEQSSKPRIRIKIIMLLRLDKRVTWEPHSGILHLPDNAKTHTDYWVYDWWTWFNCVLFTSEYEQYVHCSSVRYVQMTGVIICIQVTR